MAKVLIFTLAWTAVGCLMAFVTEQPLIILLFALVGLIRGLFSNQKEEQQ